MFIFLYGEDTYRSSQKLREIINEYRKVHKTGLNLIYFDCQNSSFEEFKNSVQSISMFHEKKLIILKQGFFNTNFKEKFLQWAKSANIAKETDNIIMVYENQTVKKTDALFKFLNTKAKSQEFNFFAGAKLQEWVDKEFEKYGARIESLARAKLINFVGNDLWHMSQEIKKLSAYKLKGVIQAKDVELLVVPKIETDIFKTIDAIAQKNKKLALLLLHKHLEKGDAPLYLLSMINFQFRNLLVVKDFMERRSAGVSSLRGASPTGRSDAAISPGYNAIRIPGMHPYVARKTSAQARKFTFDKLKKIYYRLLAIDTGIKTGKVNAQMALDMFVISI